MRLDKRYRQLSPDERDALAERVGMNPRYLWQIATRWAGKRPSLMMMNRLVAADDKLRLSDLAREFSEDVPRRVSK